MRDDLSVLAAFLAVAQERSFTKAARQRNVSPSALSHAIKNLEERLGVRLLARTTRSVSPTDAGEAFIARLAPALAEIDIAFQRLSGLRRTPAGRVRVAASPAAAVAVLGPKLASFNAAYPDVVLDITTTTEMHLNLVAGRFDAGIQLGEFIARDMIAVRVSPDQRAAIVGAPKYFAARPAPKSPRDLTAHRCINFRHGRDELYRWEFERRQQAVAVAVKGPLIVDDVQLVLRAALDGVGLAFLAEEQAAPYLRNKRLRRVLDEWCEPFPGYFLYYPSRRQQPPALTALIDTLRLR